MLQKGPTDTQHGENQYRAKTKGEETLVIKKKDDSLWRYITEQLQYQIQVMPTDVNSQSSFTFRGENVKMWDQNVLFLYQNYSQNQMLQ